MDISIEPFVEANSVAVTSSLYSARTRRFSLAIIVFSCMCVFNSVYNSFTCDGLSLYSSILFLITSLGGIVVGGLGFHAFKTESIDNIRQYMISSVVYAVIYIVNIVICSILEVFSYLDDGYQTTAIILVSTFLACFVLAAMGVCVFNVCNACNFNSSRQGAQGSYVAVKASFNDKLGYSSLHPISCPSMVQEIQLKNTRTDLSSGN